jgi:hypothetical protein
MQKKSMFLLFKQVDSLCYPPSGSLNQDTLNITRGHGLQTFGTVIQLEEISLPSKPANN